MNAIPQNFGKILFFGIVKFTKAKDQAIIKKEIAIETLFITETISHFQIFI